MILWYPFGMTDSATSKTLKSGCKVFILSASAFIQRVLPFAWPIHCASYTLLGSLIPYLLYWSQYFVLSFEIIHSHFFNVYGTHHAKSGLEAIQFSMEYSSNSIVNEYLASFKVFQVVLTSFHCIHTYQP